MKKSVDIKSVDIALNGSKISENGLRELAAVESVGHGGTFLAESMRHLVQMAVESGESFKDCYDGWLLDLDTFVGIAAGEAIRDVAVRAAVLKHQLEGSIKRREALNGKFRRIEELCKAYYNVRGAEESELELVALAIKYGEMVDDVAGDIHGMLQEWIEEDGIEGVYTDDIQYYAMESKQETDFIERLDGGFYDRMATTEGTDPDELYCDFENDIDQYLRLNGMGHDIFQNIVTAALLDYSKSLDNWEHDHIIGYNLEEHNFYTGAFALVRKLVEETKKLH